eukprot:2820221-Alexandrium_andersonii.AAC.1
MPLQDVAEAVLSDSGSPGPVQNAKFWGLQSWPDVSCFDSDEEEAKTPPPKARVPSPARQPSSSSG